jgi:hypothetical protein
VYNWLDKQYQMNKSELEKLINKPRAFRNSKLASGIPVRHTMILLGSEVVTNRETPRNYKKLKETLGSYNIEKDN